MGALLVVNVRFTRMERGERNQDGAMGRSRV